MSTAGRFDTLSSHGAVAQSVERDAGSVDVGSSILPSSTYVRTQLEKGKDVSWQR